MLQKYPGCDEHDIASRARHLEIPEDAYVRQTTSRRDQNASNSQTDAKDRIGAQATWHDHGTRKAAESIQKCSTRPSNAFTVDRMQDPDHKSKTRTRRWVGRPEGAASALSAHLDDDLRNLKMVWLPYNSTDRYGEFARGSSQFSEADWGTTP